MRQLCSPVPEMCFIPHPQGDSPPLEADVNPSVTTPELSSQARHVRRSPPTCLIVEDEAAIRELMIHILAEAGYDVLAACNAEEAKQAIRAHGEPVALVISDIRMPGGSGLDLAVDLEAARPGQPVLYISGLVDSVVVKGILLSDPRVILTKPFSAEDLLSRVRTILGDPPIRQAPAVGRPSRLKKAPAREVAGVSLHGACAKRLYTGQS
jgi:DNA-binding response OmpR family regulator